MTISTFTTLNQYIQAKNYDTIYNAIQEYIIIHKHKLNIRTYRIPNPFHIELESFRTGRTSIRDMGNNVLEFHSSVWASIGISSFNQCKCEDEADTFVCCLMVFSLSFYATGRATAFTFYIVSEKL